MKRDKLGRFMKGNIPTHPFKKGHKTWNKNLTKETDERVKKYAKKLKSKVWEKQKEIIILYNQNNLSITKIATLFNTNTTTIFNILKKNSVKIKGVSFFNKGKHPKAEFKKGQKSIRKGISLEEEYGIEKAKKIKDKNSKTIKNLWDNPDSVYNSKEYRQKLKKARNKPERIRQFKEIRAKIIIPKQDTKIEIKIREFLDTLQIEYFQHKYININHAYQCDFFIPSLNMVLETDGNYWHKYPTGREIDHIRTSELIEKGFKVLRLWESEIKTINVNGFNQKIMELK